MSGFPLGTPVMNFTGLVTNPAASQDSDGSAVTFGMGRHKDVLVAEIHGKRYYKALRGNLFTASFGGAVGVSVIAAGQTSAVACLANPATSGILMELEQIRITGATVQTDVIAGLALEGSVQTPSATTTATINGFPLGAVKGSNLGKAFQAATITAMTYLCGLGLNIQATTGPGNPMLFDADGMILLAPGFAMNLISTITQGANKLCVDMVWSEWLP